MYKWPMYFFQWNNYLLCLVLCLLQVFVFFLGDKLYELSGKHTYLPLAVLIFTSAVTLIAFIAVHKRMDSSVSRHRNVEIELDTLNSDSSNSADSEAEELSGRENEECSPLVDSRKSCGIYWNAALARTCQHLHIQLL